MSTSTNQAAPSSPPTRTSGLGDRLRTYLIGVGIGAVLLGMFWMMKRQAALQQSNTTPNGAPSAPAPRPSGN